MYVNLQRAVSDGRLNSVQDGTIELIVLEKRFKSRPIFRGDSPLKRPNPIAVVLNFTSTVVRVHFAAIGLEFSPTFSNCVSTRL